MDYWCEKGSKKRKRGDNSEDDFFNSLSSSGSIESEGNHIYFYSEVTREKILELNSQIRKITKDLQQYAIKYDTEEPKLYIHINSYGGSIFAALSTIDTILNCPLKVVTIIEGCAASAATLISVAGNERHITRNSYMLIHQLSSGFWGKMQEIEDEYKNLKKLMKMIKNIYKQHTKIKMEKIRIKLNF